MTDPELPADERTTLLPKNANGSNQTSYLSGTHEGNGSANGVTTSSTNDESPSELARKELYKDFKLSHVLPALAIGVFLSAADQTLIVANYAVIGSELNALNNTSWIASAYFLTLTSFQPLYGKLSDIFGRKAALLSAYTIFGIGALGCGLARNIQELIAARAFAGIGGGGMTTIVSILLSDVVSLRERGNYQGYINVVYATGSGLGAPLGGLFADKLSWRWAFLLQTPLCIISIIAVSLTVKLPLLPSQQLPLRKKLARIDFLGALTLVIMVTAALVGLDYGSNYSWSSPITIGALAAVIPLSLFFLLVERNFAQEPFAPFGLLLDHGLWPQYLVNFFMFGGWFAVIFYIPLYYQVWSEMDATHAGLELLPSIIGSVSGSLISGKVMSVTGRYYRMTAILQFIFPFAIASLIFGIIPLNGNIHSLRTSLAVMGLCGGTAVTTTLIALIANASEADMALVTASSYLFRSLGSVSGSAGGSAILQLVLRSDLRKRLRNLKVADGDIEKIVQGVRHSLKFMKDLDGPVKEAVKRAYRDSVTWALVLPIVLASLSFLASVFIREKKLER